MRQHARLLMVCLTCGTPARPLIGRAGCDLKALQVMEGRSDDVEQPVTLHGRQGY